LGGRLAPRRATALSIAVPGSLVSEHGGLREKTAALGLLGRAAAIYRVEEIVVYRDEPDESMLVKRILGYMEIPQYLRRHLVGRHPDLRFAGILPPLRTPHHPVAKHVSQVEVGEYREGVVVSSTPRGALVDVGLDQPLRLRGRAPREGSRVSVRVEGLNPLEGRAVKRSSIPYYWGYTLRGVRGRLSELVYGGEWDLTVATSRAGRPFKEVCGELLEAWRGAGRVLVAFGGPRTGLGEILAREGRVLEEAFDYTVNTIPLQGVETVRTEEAVHATLAVLNALE